MYVKKNLFKIISIFLFIILFIICCFITYLIINKEHNPKYKLDSYISYLNGIFNTLNEDILSDKTTEKALENIYALQKSKKNINTSMKINETRIFDHLMNSSELYIKQLSSLRSNNENINENIVALKNHFDEIINSIKYLPANSNILKETIATISKLQNTYENNFYSDKINYISTLNLNKFINNINSIMYEFLPLIEDMSENIEKANNDKYDYQLILNTLEKHSNISKNLKIKISKIPIPQEGLDIYYQIQEILELYEEYNIKLKYLIKNESLSKNLEVNQENQYNFYNQVNYMYLKILNNYNNLKHKIDSKITISDSIYN